MRRLMCHNIFMCKFLYSKINIITQYIVQFHAFCLYKIVNQNIVDEVCASLDYNPK